MMGVALASLLLVGCGANDSDWAQANAQTQASFSNPQEVGKLPDGRTVFVVERIIPKKHDHVIYFVGCSTTTIEKRTQGKATVTITTTNLDACNNSTMEKPNAVESEENTS
jgi:uncharacterized protein YcfL